MMGVMKRAYPYNYAARLGSSTVGFTIVELLVVIAVIAILASISVVAYSGAQDRANAAKAASIASSYAELFGIYRLKEGEYPEPNYGRTVCLGPPSAFPANATFAAGACVKKDEYDWGHYVSESFNSLLVPKYTNQMPPSTLKEVKIPDQWIADYDYMRGMVYRKDSGNDNGFIHYFLNGTQMCAKGDAYTYDGITECIISLNGSSTSGQEGYAGGEGSTP